jgi:hypothetical protein
MPAFSPEELQTPSLLVRPFIKDLDHGETLEQVFEAVSKYYPQINNQAVPIAAQAG